MGEIDRPGIKQILWHRMRDDLKTLVPWFTDKETLLCPTCCRALKFDDFSLEHIIPEQALADDPAEARAAIPRNERSGLTLLCQTPLYVQGHLVYAKGCNSWKGRFYDRFLREALRGEAALFTQRHSIALLCAGYLGLVRRFGYQVVLMPSGLLMRRQFFTPNAWQKDMPSKSQMVLMGQSAKDYQEDQRIYWSEPFKFAADETSVVMVVRSVSVSLPISRDLRVPLARVLPYAPPAYKLRPDLTSAFD